MYPKFFWTYWRDVRRPLKFPNLIVSPACFGHVPEGYLGPPGSTCRNTGRLGTELRIIWVRGSPPLTTLAVARYKSQRGVVENRHQGPFFKSSLIYYYFNSSFLPVFLSGSDSDREMAKQSYMNTIKRNEGVNYSESTVSCPRTFSLPGRGLLREV